jgi:serine/threonine protein phosphatase PrpC
MRFAVTAVSDIGISRNVNQDCLSAQVIHTPLGEMALGILCDGVGGFSEGEVASSMVVKMFENWVYSGLPDLCQEQGNMISKKRLQTQWEELVNKANQSLNGYGLQKGFRIGTTLTALLVTQTDYFILNVGDSRAYEISNRSGTFHLTTDQTFQEREFEAGMMTYEEVIRDSRANALLQSIGGSKKVEPDMYAGKVMPDHVYMLCSDGFRHKITDEEFYQKLKPSVLVDEAAMQNQSKFLIELNKERNERDNISVLLVRTFED